MEVVLAAICDAANSNSKGKLNLLGVFDQITVSKFPATHPQCCVVFRLIFHKNESTEQDFTIKFLDRDNKSFLPSIKATSTSKCIKFEDQSILNLIVNLNNIKLQTTNDYRVELHINKTLLKKIDLRIRRAVPTGK